MSSEHILNEGHEMKTIEEIIHLENNHRKINKHEEIEILKTSSPKYLLIDVVAGQNDPMYKLLPSSVNSKINIQQTKQQKKFQNPTIEIINDLNSNCQLPRPSNKRNFETQQ